MDIRSNLTAALKKRNYGPPNIKIRSQRSPFCAEAIVPGINCIGRGRANSKKDARFAALKDLASHLTKMDILVGEIIALTVIDK